MMIFTTISGAKHQFRVSSVHDAVIYGDHDSVPFSEIASVQRREISESKTTLLAVLISAVVGGLAAAIHSGIRTPAFDVRSHAISICRSNCVTR